MTLICCPIHVDGAGQVEEALAKARSAVAKGAKLIEWRADLLAEEIAEVAVPAIRTLVAESPAPCILTIRPTWEGGLYAGSESDRVSLFEAIGTGSPAPRYFDIELDAYRTSRNRRQKLNLAVDHADQVRDVEPRLILSTHDFGSRPADLLQRVAAMAAEPACAVMKIAWTARSIRDNLEAFDLLADRVKPSVALCMGEFGLMSRVLAGKFGGLFTFAALDRGEESAPGQPSIDELRGLYRFDRVNAATRVYGVIGALVSHSRSPTVHNAGFSSVEFDGVYLPMPIPREYEHFKASVGAMIDHPTLTFRGASITIPHKEHCVRFVRERGGHVGAIAAALGAANTLIVEDDGTIACANTDAAAAVEAIVGGLRRVDGRLDGVRVAILGAGGVARAVAGGVAIAGGRAVVFARDAARAEALASDVMRGIGALDANDADQAEQISALIGAKTAPGNVTVGRCEALGCGCFEVFVNCTPVGMSGGPAADGDPVESLAASVGQDVTVQYDGVLVMDTVYVPRETPWLRTARDRGATCVYGSDMFVRQACRQFTRWTRRDAPRATFDALAQVLSHD